MTAEPAAMSETVDSQASPSVAVCTITFRRPVGLEKLLKGISGLTFLHTSPQVKVVVIENEEHGPGRAVCDRLRPTFPFALEHSEEPRRGIPFARNTAIARAGEVDFIAFIDDDEIPEPTWLDELLRVQAQYDTDLVGGPVLPVYESPPPAWIVEGGFHKQARFATGARELPNGTNNVLLRRAAIAEISEPFETRFALTGGSDTVLFQRLARAGCSTVWADEALVREDIPQSRATARWILARTFRTSVTRALVAKESDTPLRLVAYVLWRALRHFLLGVASLPINLCRGRGATVRSLRRIVRAAGFVSGLVGYHYQEYRKVHGK